MQHWPAIVQPAAPRPRPSRELPETPLAKQSPKDIAAFPELFEGMEQFVEEQAVWLRRTLLAALALVAGMAAYPLLQRLF